MQLIVLCHGMWGKASDFNYIVGQLESRGYVSYDKHSVESSATLSAARGILYCARSNEGYFTYDGIDICGMRLADEICDVLHDLQDVKIDSLSVVGYSMGGPITRYAIGVLESRGCFDAGGFLGHPAIKPRVFVNTCSPHVGTNVLGNRWSARLFNFIGSWSMARTSRQCFLRDSHTSPLFLQMTQPNTIWTKALARFERRVCYANITNDRRCDFYTSSANSVDPFAGKDLHQLKGPFVPGFEPVVLQDAEPQFEVHADEDGLPKKRTWKSRLLRILKLQWLAARVLVVLPVWFMAFLVNAGYQASLSAVRTKRQPQLDSMLELSANNMVESIYETVQDSPVAEPSLALCLTPMMRRIIENFNKLGFEKYYLNILTTPMAHAAAIMKLERPEWYEGIPAVEHLLTNF